MNIDMLGAELGERSSPTQDEPAAGPLSFPGINHWPQGHCMPCWVQVLLAGPLPSRQNWGQHARRSLHDGSGEEKAEALGLQSLAQPLWRQSSQTARSLLQIRSCHPFGTCVVAAS